MGSSEDGGPPLRLLFLRRLADMSSFSSNGSDCKITVYNHLRHWRARWVHVCKLKKMEGVRWVEKTSAIMMDDDAYFAYTKNHPRDAELLNKPIENYAQMKRIYTGRVPAAPLTPVVVHRALSHLMDHKTQATKYLAMTPDARMAWFNAFLTKYYL